MICRLHCLCICWCTPPHFVVLHGCFLSFRPVGQLQRQLALRSYSRWYFIRSGVGMLARRICSALNICRKIWWLFWFCQLQGPFESSLSALNWHYVTKDWYTFVNFQGCILCGAIRNKKKVLTHIKDWSFYFMNRGYFFQMFFIVVKPPECFLIFGYNW